MIDIVIMVDNFNIFIRINMIRKVLSKTFKIAKSVTVFGSIYFLGCYMYLQEINYRIGEVKMSNNYLKHLEMVEANQSAQKTLSKQDRSLQSFILKIYINWNRIWHYREYQQDCKILTKELIVPILESYKSRGIFQQKEAIEKSIKKHRLNDHLLQQIFKIKEENSQFSEHYTLLIQKVKILQLLMDTQKVISLQSQSKQKIDLIYTFIVDQLKLMKPAMLKMDPQHMKLQDQMQILDKIDPNDIISKLTLL